MLRDGRAVQSISYLGYSAFLVAVIQHL